VLFAKETELDVSKSVALNGAGKSSTQAQTVYDAGLELWRYYHSQKNAPPPMLSSMIYASIFKARRMDA
jgi:hypothetical protein